MASSAALGKHDLSAIELALVAGEVSAAAGRVLQIVGAGRGEKEKRHIGGLRLGRLPIARIPVRHRDFERRELRAANERSEVLQPFLAEQADVHEHAVQRAKSADRIGSVFEDPRRPYGIGCLVELRQGAAGRNIFVEMLVVQLTACKLLLAPSFRQRHPRAKVVDRVHGARVVHIVGGNKRGVERAGTRGVEQLICEARLVHVPNKDAIDPEILRARIGVEILPLGVFRIGRRVARIRPDVTETAGHADSIRLDELLVVVVGRIRVIAFGVPALCRRVIEVGIGKQPQPDNAGRVAVVGTDRNVLASGADLDAGILRFVLERIRRTGFAPDVEPQAIAVFARAVAFVEARLVHQAEILPTVVATVILYAGMVGDGLEKIQDAGALYRQPIPKAVVAASPNDPVVAAFYRRGNRLIGRDARDVGSQRRCDLRRVFRNAIVHVTKIVLVGREKAFGGAAHAHGFVEDAPGTLSAHRDQGQGAAGQSQDTQCGKQPCEAPVAHCHRPIQ